MRSLTSCLGKPVVASMLVSSLILGVVAYGEEWTPTGAPALDWLCVASSADGSILAAGTGGTFTNGGIYVSTNAGASWTRTSAPLTNWGCLASSADGTKLTAGVGIHVPTGPIFFSTNSGTTWSKSDAPQANWWSVASSADGTKQVAGGLSGMYVSTNSGANWTQTSVPLERWVGVASSADGIKLAAAPAFLGFFESNSLVYISTNSGGSWSPRVTGTSDFIAWHEITSSADGTRLAAAGDGDTNGSAAVFLSADSGGTWTISNTATNPNSFADTSLASSADGCTLAEAIYNDRIYISTNCGATWTPTVSTNRLWSSVTTSADGGRIVGTQSSGGIYARQSTVLPQLKIAVSGSQLILSWIVPSTSFNLESTSDLGAANWTQVAAAPIMTNLHYEVVLPTPISNTYYRLASP